MSDRMSERDRMSEILGRRSSWDDVEDLTDDEEDEQKEEMEVLKSTRRLVLRSGTCSAHPGAPAHAP